MRRLLIVCEEHRKLLNEEARAVLGFAKAAFNSV